jgi:hypothetical protein
MAQGSGQQVVGTERRCFFGKFQASQRMVHRAGRFRHADLGACGKDGVKPLREMIGKILRFFARIRRLDQQDRDGRPLGRHGPFLAREERCQGRYQAEQRYEDSTPVFVAIVDYLQSHARPSVLTYGRGA